MKPLRFSKSLLSGWMGLFSITLTLRKILMGNLQTLTWFYLWPSLHFECFLPATNTEDKGQNHFLAKQILSLLPLNSTSKLNNSRSGLSLFLRLVACSGKKPAGTVNVLFRDLLSRMPQVCFTFAATIGDNSSFIPKWQGSPFLQPPAFLFAAFPARTPSKANVTLQVLLRFHWTPRANTHVLYCCCCCSVTDSCLTLRPQPMPSRLPCPSLSSRVCSSSCLLSQWCYLTISTSATAAFSFHLQSLPASGSFPRSQLFASGGQSIGISASASVLPMNIQLISFRIDWFPCSPRDPQESSPTPQFKDINSLALSLLYGPTLISTHDYWKNHSFD